MEIRERDLGENSGDQQEISERSMRDAWRSVGDQRRAVFNQGEIRERRGEIRDCSARDE